MVDTVYPGPIPAANRDPAYPGPTPAVNHTVERTTLLSGGGTHIHRRISWGAIFGGVVLVVVVQLLLATLGAGIGLGTVHMNTGSTPNASNLGMTAGIWWIVSTCIALLFGGYVAAWLAGIELRFDGMLHGLITWGVATLLTVYLLTSAIGGVIGGGLSMLGGAASAAGNGIAAAAGPATQASGVTPNMVQDQAKAYLQPANPDPATMSPQDAQKEIATNLVTYEQGGNDAPAAKARVIAIMAAQQKISPADAETEFNNDQAKFEQKKAQAEQTAKNAADTTAAAASVTSFAAFGMLLLGAIFAAIGGALAARRRLLTTARVA